MNDLKKEVYNFILKEDKHSGVKLKKIFTYEWFALTGNVSSRVPQHIV